MNLTLADNEYSLDRIGLKKWIELEELRENYLKAAESKNMDDTASSICSYVSAVFAVNNLSELPWYEVASAFITLMNFCIPIYDFAVLRPKDKFEERNKISWDYSGRTWYLWSHILANSYGWNLEYIAEMDFNDGLALLQEILVEEQLDKEWQWSMNEIAYPYNQSTKRSEFKPLPRPSWMKEEIILPPVRKVKIPQWMMPVGNVIRLGKGDEVPTH